MRNRKVISVLAITIVIACGIAGYVIYMQTLPKGRSILIVPVEPIYFIIALIALVESIYPFRYPTSSECITYTLRWAESN